MDGRHTRLAPLWEELARRMGASARPVAIVTLRDLDLSTRTALADLLGLDRLPPTHFSVRTSRIAAALGIEPGDLRLFVETIQGPIGNRSAERREQVQARAALWAWFEDRAQRIGPAAWTARVRAGGIPGGDIETHRRRLSEALAVLTALPAEGVSLAGLAADMLGDPHALDPGTWTGSAVLDALACLRNRPRAVSAEDRRELWSLFGVETDELSPTVLTIALAPQGDDALATLLIGMAATAEPASLTLSQLRRWPVRVTGQPDVFVFENPSMIAEAAARAWTGPPLVCTSGWPNVAVVTLLRQLRDSGAVLRLHADLDPDGLGIVRFLEQRVGGTSWKMDPADFSALRIDSAAPSRQAGPEQGRRWYEEDVRSALLDVALRLWSRDDAGVV